MLGAGLSKSLDRHLSHKFVFTLSLCLISISLFFAVFILERYQAQLTRERGAASASVNHLLQVALENAMLKRDLAGLRTIVHRLGQQPNIRNAFITNLELEIRFASNPEWLGRGLGVGSADDPWQLDMQRLAREGAFTRFLHDERGGEILRSVNPVANREACVGCHDEPAKNPINGILFIDYDAAPLRERAREDALLLLGAGLLALLFTVGVMIWFMRRFVLRPVARLAEASRALAEGELTHRARLASRDELGLLARTFNRMAANLQRGMDALAQQKAFLQALIDAVPEGIRVIDQDYRVVLANRVYHQQLGKREGEAVDEPCYVSSHRRQTPCPATLVTCPLEHIRESGQPLKLMDEFRRGELGDLPVEVCAAPVAGGRDQAGEPRLLIVEAIRDLRQATEFSHEQKLSSIGQLAVSIAHEIHNPLASIRLALQGNLRALRAAHPDIAEIAQYLELVDDRIDHCMDITHRLLKLSNAGSERAQLLELAEIAEETLSLLRYEGRQKGIELETSAEAGEFRVLAVDAELRMLVLNLVQNAFHAMPEGGQVNVYLSHVGEEIELRVQDNGVAIPESMLDKIFDPFFTRRADGQTGTGLGLAICKNIVDRGGGRILARNNPERGACFVVYWPEARQTLMQGENYEL